MSITNIRNTIKSKYISHIILEGVDGVGKTTLVKLLSKKLKYQWMVYDRGEISNYVYAKKYNRLFTTVQRGMPILYVILTASKDELLKRLLNRDNFDDLSKVEDQDQFIKAAKLMEKDYHIMVYDTTGKNPFEITEELSRRILFYMSCLQDRNKDTNKTMYNNMYEKGSRRIGDNVIYSIDGQPYLNHHQIASDLTYYNGAFETYTDHKTCPISLAYSFAYNISVLPKKTYDFVYIINSKINRRPEVLDYINEIKRSKKTMLPNFAKNKKVFGDEYIAKIACAKATIYTARELAYLKCLNARFYESILAQQIIFVDGLTDPDNELLKQIHKDKKIRLLLYVEPKTLIKNYNYIIKHKTIYNKIIKNQNAWYKKLLKDWLCKN